MNDQIANLLARIQNAVMRRKLTVNVPNTKTNRSILEILKTEGMAEAYTDVEREIEVDLAYENEEPVVEKFKRVSSPGQRIYVSAKEIFPVMNGRGISIISTSEGLMVGALAKSKGLGGELICKIW